MMVGAGAVGCSVMNRLMKVSDFTLIVDEGRKERYKNGIFYNGERLDVAMKTPNEADEKADLIIYATKNFHLDAAIEESRPFVGDDTVLLSLLNGIEAETKLSEAFGKEKVLYGFITGLSSNHSGLETNCFTEGIVIFGEKDNCLSDRVKKQQILIRRLQISLRERGIDTISQRILSTRSGGSLCSILATTRSRAS